jgi:DNA/RNA endonuclease YhcR with UshA esterase domain
MQDPKTGCLEVWQSEEALAAAKEKEPRKKHWRVISVGEIVEINGVILRVRNITKQIVVLQPATKSEIESFYA